MEISVRRVEIVTLKEGPSPVTRYSRGGHVHTTGWYGRQQITISTTKPLRMFGKEDRARIVCSYLNELMQYRGRYARTWTLWMPGYKGIRTARVLKNIVFHGWYDKANLCVK